MRRMTKMPDSFVSIINLWPTLQDFADDIGVPYVNANLMRQRDSIAADHWAAMVDAARRRGIKGVSTDRLARLKAEKAAAKRPLERRRSRHEGAAA